MATFGLASTFTTVKAATTTTFAGATFISGVGALAGPTAAVALVSLGPVGLVALTKAANKLFKK